MSPTYTYGYGLIIIPRVYTNAYWSDTYKQTYEPMYGYYKHENYFNAKGYYSDKFSKIYYDGYGYNFYYGGYAYYEYSTHPTATSSIITYVLSITVAVICFGCICWSFCSENLDYQVEEEVEEESYYEEYDHVTTTTTHTKQ